MTYRARKQKALTERAAHFLANIDTEQHALVATVSISKLDGRDVSLVLAACLRRGASLFARNVRANVRALVGAIALLRWRR